jgi:hypothetical protein
MITNSAPYELAVLKFSGDKWALTYETPVTDDVERGDAECMNAMLAQIESLPPAPSIAALVNEAEDWIETDF